jgi:dephospho-CoA kinase
MVILGLTGSIGMGKSTAAGFFAEAGAPVHDADAAVHRLYAGAAAPAIEAAFPGTTASGKVDRGKLAERVIDEGAGVEVAVLNIPLLFETGGEQRCDAVVVVSAPPEMQRERVMTRPGMTEEKFASLLGKQLPDAEKRRRADFVVDTSKDLDSTRAQVRAILAAAARLPNRHR